MTTNSESKKRIFISACELSGDKHCAELIKAVNQIPVFGDEVEWVGIGGELMTQAGCELLEKTTDRAAMLYNVVKQIKFYRQLLQRISAYFESNKIDLVIVCDSPAFNFHVAKAGQKIGSEVLFYVAPQLWAWAPWRIGKLRRLSDKVACILPFEEVWFTERAVKAVYVGNPLFDNLNIDVAKSCKEYLDFDYSSAKLALMPGSRNAEINSLWPAMQRIALKLQKKWIGMEFMAVAANQEKLEMLKSKEINGFKCEYVTGEVTATASRADFTLVSSGSATLQVAAGGCPMIIMYQSSRILWHLLGRWLINTRFLSLVNILAGRELVPEFMPHYGATGPVYEKCKRLLINKSLLVKTSRELVELVKPMVGHNASQKTAQIVAEMTEENHTP